jgi:hypothetical protein
MNANDLAAMDAQMRIWLEAEMSIWHRYLVNTLSAPGYRRGGVAPEVARRFRGVRNEPGVPELIVPDEMLWFFLSDAPALPGEPVWSGPTAAPPYPPAGPAAAG